MMLNIGQVSVRTTDGRGETPAELAAACASRIVSVSDTAAPEIREQAHAFKARVARLVEIYMLEAIRQHEATQEAQLRRRVGGQG